MQLSSAAQMWAGCALWQPTNAIVSALTYHDSSGQVKIGCHTCLGLINPAGNAHVCFAWENNRFDGLAEGRLQAVYPLKDFGSAYRHSQTLSSMKSILKGLAGIAGGRSITGEGPISAQAEPLIVSAITAWLLIIYFYGFAMGHSKVQRSSDP